MAIIFLFCALFPPAGTGELSRRLRSSIVRSSSTALDLSDYQSTFYCIKVMSYVQHTLDSRLSMLQDYASVELDGSSKEQGTALKQDQSRVLNREWMYRKCYDDH